ncbi:hypothetical protein FA95DRAFT_517700 [Auriscalpium vulgare]|uniref:Uncharacterized protein n=1 Tax=Auriscalpium vulgare TaxID=40419 RepID=A0ACB8S4L8_9AGAM|nr:hypothetical protein FA95DRAFT_517700 [Auriscalpium vulgare]
MHDALKDLDALMIKAREMVRLANELNERLTASSSTTANPYSSPSASASSSFSSAPALVPSTEPEEATFIRSSLAQLGLQMENTPVTLDMIRDEKRWHEELARELAGVLQGTVAGRARGGILGARGIVALDEVWGGWNRARGVALITPEQFLQVLPHLPAHTEPPLLTRAFARTGLRVLHTPAYTPAAFAARLHGLLLAAGPRTALEVAWDEDVPVGLVTEMVGEAEAQGTVVRDVAGSEVRWWTDVFTGYVWDGQE